MKKLFAGVSLTLCVLFTVACKPAAVYVGPDDAQVKYQGRIWYEDDAAVLSWPGVSVGLHFEGKSIAAVLKDADTSNYYNVLVDGRVVAIIHPDSTHKKYTLATGLSEGAHEVQLFKRTEWDKGNTLFYGFELEEGGTILPPVEKKRKIEFYGNSITCGFGNEDYSGRDRHFGYFQNNYETYAAKTARHFDAEYRCIAKSGIGILVSWFPMIMPEMYKRTNPTDPASEWDFAKYTPDVVVINLFQNDSWIVQRSDNAEFQHRFGDTPPDSTQIINGYINFVKKIRTEYPEASIVCALGNMDATREGSPWPGYIQSAVKHLDDAKIYSCIFPFKNTGGHPRVEEQQMMADQLIGFIEEHIGW